MERGCFRLFWTTRRVNVVPCQATTTMAFLNRIKRGGHGITIDRDLSTGMSRDLFVLDEVLFVIDVCMLTI